MRRLIAHYSYWAHPGTWPRATAVTIGLVLLGFAIHGHLYGIADPVGLVVMGAYYPPAVWSGELWRLVTPLFLHAGWLHLSVNLIALLVCGDVERLIGTRWWIAVYLASGIAGCAASGLTPPMTMSVGASAAIYGVLGVLVTAIFGRFDADAQFHIRWTLYPAAIVLIAVDTLGSIALVNGLLGWDMQPDVAGHAGGLLCGIWMAHVILPPRPGAMSASLETMVCGRDGVWRMHRDRRKFRILGVGSVCLLALVAYSARPIWHDEYHRHRVDAMAYAGDLAGAEQGYLRLLADGGDDDIRLRLATIYRAQGRGADAVPLLTADLEPAEIARLAHEARLMHLVRVYPRLAERARAEAQLGRRAWALSLIDALPAPDELVRNGGQALRAQAWNNYAMVLLTLDLHAPLALHLAGRAVAVDRNAAFLDTQAWALHKLGKSADARRLLEEALQHGSIATAEVRYRLATVMHALGDPDAEARLLRAALAVPIELPFAQRLDAHRRLRALSS